MNGSKIGKDSESKVQGDEKITQKKWSLGSFAMSARTKRIKVMSVFP